MRRTHLPLLAGATALALGSLPSEAVAGPVVTVLPPSADATVRDGTRGSLGTKRDLSLTERDFCLVRFDLDQIPPGSTVRRATLRLFLTARRGGESSEILVNDVLGPWSETTVTSDDEVPLGEILASGIFVTARRDRFVEIDLTHAARAWVEDVSENHGVALLAREGGLRFSSREGTFSPPQLQLTYEPSEVALAPAAGDVAGLGGAMRRRAANGVLGSPGKVGPGGAPGRDAPPSGSSIATGAIATMNGTLDIEANQAVGALVLVSGPTKVGHLSFFVPPGGNTLGGTSTIDFEAAILDGSFARIGGPAAIELVPGREGLIRVGLPKAVVLPSGVYYLALWRGLGSGAGTVKVASQAGLRPDADRRWYRGGVPRGIPARLKNPGAAADVPWIGAGS